jgi:hypothetical protein
MGMAFVANKRAIALEEAAKKKEDNKLTKLKKAQEKKDKAVAKHLKGLLGASKNAFKKTWEPSAVKEAGQKLHDTIKENHPINPRIPYCGTQPWQCKHNQKPNVHGEKNTYLCHVSHILWCFHGSMVFRCNFLKVLKSSNVHAAPICSLQKPLLQVYETKIFRHI